MLRFAADENFNNHFIRGFVRRTRSIDLVRVQDVGLGGADDESILDWAAEEDRILLTHDVRTVTRWAIVRLE